MSEELKGQMERRPLQQGVPASPSTRSSSVKETAARGKQWIGPRKYEVGLQYPNQRNRCPPNHRGNNEKRNTRPVYQENWSYLREGYNYNSRKKFSEYDFPLDVKPAQQSLHPKKTKNSWDYLLNFKPAPRERTFPQRSRSSCTRYIRRFHKERFLQANCQFVVSDSADYAVNTVDQDLLVDWSLIEQVRMFSHEVSSCPICLYPPKVAKITRCGHVYCWSCILHYFSQSETKWPKCPICFEIIEKEDLKSVIVMERHPFAVGQTITMRLMMKEKDSTLVLPKSQWNKREMMPFKINDSVETCYSKLLLASPEDVLQQIIDKEESALSVQYMEANMEQSSDLCFIETAELELKTRKDELIEKVEIMEKKKSKKSMKSRCMETEEVEKSLKKVSLDCSYEEYKECEDSQRENLGWNVYLPDANCFQNVGEYEAAFSDEESPPKGIGTDNNDNINDTKTHDGVYGQESGEPVQESSSPTSPEEGCELFFPKRNLCSITSRTKQRVFLQEHPYRYFYQAEDGQNIFLHSLNASCLIQEYGDFENCPEYITGKILEMTATSQTEVSRKRYGFLRHLPLTCEFTICELELKPPLVSDLTLECFKEAIQKREQKRQKKLKVEKRRELKAKSKMKMSSFVPSKPYKYVEESLDIFSEVDFPTQYSPPLSMAMSPLSHGPGPFTQLAASEARVDEGFIDGTKGSTTQESTGISPPSFAQALRTGKAAEVTKPVKKHVQEDAKRDSISEDEDYGRPPTYQSAVYDAISIVLSRGLKEAQTKDASDVCASDAGPVSPDVCTSDTNPVSADFYTSDASSVSADVCTNGRKFPKKMTKDGKQKRKRTKQKLLFTTALTFHSV